MTRPTEVRSLKVTRVLTDSQKAMLQALRDGVTHVAVPSLSIRPKFGIDNAILVGGSAFTTSATHIDIAGIGKLAAKNPISRRHVGFKKRYLCLIERGEWMAHIALARRSRQKRQIKPQIVSGGLPFLGKGSK